MKLNAIDPHSDAIKHGPARDIVAVREVLALVACRLGVTQKYLLVGSTGKAKRIRRLTVILCHYLHPEIRQRRMSEALQCSTSYISRVLSEYDVKSSSRSPIDVYLHEVFDELFCEQIGQTQDVCSPFSVGCKDSSHDTA